MGFVSNVNLVAEYLDDLGYTGIDASTDITYGEGVPTSTINPSRGTNAIYMDTETNTSYICIDATTDANVWVVNGSGQFVDIGTTIGKGVAFTAATSGVEDIVIPTGVNAFSVDNFELADGASLTIEDGATYKVV